MTAQSADYVLPEGMTAEKLRAVAHWLDMYDEMAWQFMTLLEKSAVVGPLATAAKPAVRNSQVQEDLRRWADQIDGNGCA